MARIGIPQFAGSEIQHAHEKGDEHQAVVPGRHGGIDGREDFRRVVFGGGERPEHRTDLGHHQRRGNPLAGHVSDTEEQLAVAETEVIQVAADRLGRSDTSVDVYVVSLRESGPSHGQHRHLDLACHVQLSLHRSLLHRRLRQLRDIFLERFLHIVEGVAEEADLVIPPDRREFRVKVSQCHFLGRVGQADERLGRMPDGKVADDEDDHQAQEDQEDDNGPEQQTREQQPLRRDDDTHRPAGIEERGIIHVGFDAVDLDGHLS